MSVSLRHHQQGLSHCHDTCVAAAKHTIKERKRGRRRIHLLSQSQAGTRQVHRQVSLFFSLILTQTLTHSHSSKRKKTTSFPQMSQPHSLSQSEEPQQSQDWTKGWEGHSSWINKKKIKKNSMDELQGEVERALHENQHRRQKRFIRIVKTVFLTCSHWLHHIAAWDPDHCCWHHSLLEDPGEDTKIKSSIWNLLLPCNKIRRKK